ncbi:hypothetical protein Nepgr_033846 [Nepenthes gracilis]|uniref:Uncharacterized protein n=1 Tax=Nepenthes gracilis TaxID=150966 RepID=A0AAD3TM60_NEPGR|nr:hypothetical protein Nepgr_033846 [Nepenthes gracilis]
MLPSWGDKVVPCSNDAPGPVLNVESGDQLAMLPTGAVGGREVLPMDCSCLMASMCLTNMAGAFVLPRSGGSPRFCYLGDSSLSTGWIVDLVSHILCGFWGCSLKVETTGCWPLLTIGVERLSLSPVSVALLLLSSERVTSREFMLP